MGDAVGPPGAVDAQMFPILDKGRIADADVLPGRGSRYVPTSASEAKPAKSARVES